MECFSNNNPLSANVTRWSNTLKQFVGNLPANCLSVFGHFVGLALKEIRWKPILALFFSYEFCEIFLENSFGGCLQKGVLRNFYIIQNISFWGIPKKVDFNEYISHVSI